MIPKTAPGRTAISIRLRRRFNVPRESVFRAWTDPSALRQWWCPDGWTPADVEVNLRSGGAYRIGMRRLTGGAPVYVHGRFLEVHAPQRLVYTWNWENAFEDMPETQVTVEFRDIDGKTEVVLYHEQLPAGGICLAHLSGWKAAWKRVEVALEYPMCQ